MLRWELKIVEIVALSGNLRRQMGNEDSENHLVHHLLMTDNTGVLAAARTSARPTGLKGVVLRNYTRQGKTHTLFRNNH